MEGGRGRRGMWQTRNGRLRERERERERQGERLMRKNYKKAERLSNAG